MYSQNNLTVGQWCDRWFRENRSRWSVRTVGGYRNLIDRHISPGIGNIPLTELTQDTVTGFYDSLRSRGLNARSVWCVHLLLRRCMGEAARDQLIPCNPVQICPEPPAEAHKTVPLRLGQLQRYLNAAEQFGTLPLIYTGLTSGLRQCELLALSWADFYIRYRYILKGQRLLTLNDKQSIFWRKSRKQAVMCFSILRPERRIGSTSSTISAKRILKQAGLPWACFPDLQCQCRKVGL